MSATQTLTRTTSTTLTTEEYVPRGPVTSTLTFYSPPADGSAPYNYVEPQPEGTLQRNYGAANHEVLITDVRGRESEYTLDKDAFQTLQGISSEETEFNDDEHIKSVYYPEVEKLLLDNVPGANKVFLFDHTIRRAQPNAHRAPVLRAHVDQTAQSTKQRVEFHLPDEAEELLKGRYRIINVWRPINGTVTSHPLGFASAASVADGDLVGVEHRYPDRTGETAGVKYNGNQEWHYWSGMGNEERLLLKCWDSVDEKGIGRRVPHTAFVDPRSPVNGKGRESIEVRALVFG
jgi:hypothetical protein